ncbi:MAG: hypothetical protein JXR76_28275 [Deltaproteobacteria bacterium]|nr:hypothetical protein [Deltaproteobacteria bacterium]
MDSLKNTKSLSLVSTVMFGRRTPHILPVLFVTGLVVTLPTISNSAITPSPKYLAAVIQEITRLGHTIDCSDSSGLCTVQQQNNAIASAKEKTEAAVTIQIDDASATVSLVINDFLNGEVVSNDTMRKLMELNHKMIVAKLSINPENDTVTLCAVINTDSNFDRKTFRSVFKGFIEVAAEIKKQLFAQN